MNELEQKTKEYIEFIKNSDAFKAFEEASNALQINEPAQKLLEDVQERQDTIAVLQQKGLPISKEQIAAFNNAIEIMHNNEICSEFLRTSNKATSIAKNICNQLSDATGIMFKGGGCCGGGGCC